MFFVGSTGQLLTLILTVVLPLVLLASPTPKIISPSQGLNIERLEIATTIHISNDNTTHYSDHFLVDDQIAPQEIELPHKQKIPIVDSCRKCISFYLQSSGNNSPPQFLSFSC